VRLIEGLENLTVEVDVLVEMKKTPRGGVGEAILIFFATKQSG
jgi:hypothetical protein